MDVVKSSMIRWVCVGFSLLVFGAIGKEPVGANEVRKSELSPLPLLGEAREEAAKYRMKAYRFERNGVAFDCLLHSPKPKGIAKFPLVVYVPGSGEIGDLNNQFRQRGIFERLTSEKFQRQHPCHFLAISPPATVKTMRGGRPGEPTAMQMQAHDLIREIARIAAPKVDPERIYLTGYSYGGGAAYALGGHFPETFAAVVPIATIPYGEEYVNAQCPGNWWHLHNEGDYESNGVSTMGLKRLRDSMNAAGGDFRLGTFAAEGHDAWSTVWENDEIWSWMFSKHRRRVMTRKRTDRPQKAGYAMSLADARCSASVAGLTDKTGPERALDGLDETGYVPARGFTKDDWWQLDFAKPVSGRVRIFSGTKKGERRLRNAIAEVSDNGRTWARVGSFAAKDGACDFVRSAKFSHLRVRPTDVRPQTFCLRRVAVLPDTK